MGWNILISLVTNGVSLYNMKFPRTKEIVYSLGNDPRDLRVQFSDGIGRVGPLCHRCVTLGIDMIGYRVTGMPTTRYRDDWRKQMQSHFNLLTQTLEILLWVRTHFLTLILAVSRRMVNCLGASIANVTCTSSRFQT